MFEGGEDGNAGVKAGDHIIDSDRHLGRRSVGLAGDAQHAAQALCHHVITRPVGVGTVLAVSSNRAVNDTRKLGMDTFVIEAELRKAADLEVLDQNVRVGE